MLERSRTGSHRLLLTLEDWEKELARPPAEKPASEDVATAIGQVGLSNGTHTNERMGTVKPPLGEILRQERLASPAPDK